MTCHNPYLMFAHCLLCFDFDWIFLWMLIQVSFLIHELALHISNCNWKGAENVGDKERLRKFIVTVKPSIRHTVN